MISVCVVANILSKFSKPGTCDEIKKIDVWYFDCRFIWVDSQWHQTVLLLLCVGVVVVVVVVVVVTVVSC